jgi:hypothetical protein
VSKGNYERLIPPHSRELLEGTVGAIARSAKEDGVEKGIRKERERILAILNKMSDTASATGTRAGTKTVWVIENAIALIERENLS